MDLIQLITSQTHTSLCLAKQLSVNHEALNSNLAFSPLSIQIVLSILSSGSDGQTLEQFISFFNSKSTQDLISFYSQAIYLLFSDATQIGGPNLSFANGVWLDKSLSFKPEFKQIVDKIYNAASIQADFLNKPEEVIGEVNSWAERETSGLIKEVLPPGSVDHMTRLIFTNALYFKGCWAEKFEATNTTDYDFHLLNGKLVKSPFMTSNKKQLIQIFDGFKVLGIPYKQGNDKRSFSMYIFLPDKKNGLLALINLAGSEPGFLTNHLPYETVEVGEFWIPKFKVSFGFDASNVLKDLGLVLPFSAGGMNNMVNNSCVGRDIYVSSIFHKAFVEVNEEGTEAGAATAAVVALRSLRVNDKVDFVADHPFMFVIREDVTGLILFVGHLADPSHEG